MELEIQRNNSQANRLSKDTHFIAMTSAKSFQLKKAVRHLNKYVTQASIYDQLVQLFENTEQILIGINLLAIFQYFLTRSPDLNIQIEQRLRWIIISIYRIRQNLEASNHSQEEKLQYLNRILIIFNNLASYMSTKGNSNKNRMSQKSLFLESIDLILALSRQRNFSNIANDLFQANLFLKIIELNPLNLPLNQILMKKIIYHLQLVEQYKHHLDQATKEILLNTYIKSIKNINYSTYFLQKLDTILKNFPNRSNLRLLYQAKIYKIEYISTQICSNQSEFELFTLIIAGFSESFPEECPKLSQIWINNLYYLMRGKCQVELQSLINDFDEPMLSYIYSKINQLIEITIDERDSKNAAFQIWGLFLLANKVYNLVARNKHIVINIEVILHRFQREILRIIPFSIDPNLYKLVLSVFAKYYKIILKQEECKDLNQQTILFIIQHFPQLVNESLLFLRHQQKLDPSIINFDNYHLHYLDLLAKRCMKESNFGVFLGTLDKRVSKIILKYVIQTNLFTLTNVLNQDDLIMYTIQNDIQLHLDKYDHILQNKLYQNLDKYLSLVSNRKLKNRYRHTVVTCLLNILINQKELPSPNRKLLNINSQNLIFIIQNLDLLISISQENNIMEPSYLLSVILCLAIRSLYYNIPLLVHYLIVIILLLNKNTYNFNLSKEFQLISQQLIKFSKMYSSYKQYQLIGLATFLFISSGLLNYTGILSSASQNIDYWVAHILFVLEGQTQLINFQIVNLKYWSLLKKVFNKCLILSLIRYLSFVSNYSQKNTQYKQIMKIIDYLINKQVSDTKSNTSFHISYSRKRMITEQNLQQQQQQKHIKQPHFDWLEAILNNIIQYDEFQQYRQLSRKLQVPLAGNQNAIKFNRIHGKIRTIIHIKK